MPKVTDNDSIRAFHAADVMVKVKISDYLFKRIKDAGVDCTFGIPGDFVLPLYNAQERSGLQTVVMTHEPSVGFAADAYARLKGLGVALVTFGAGGLNMVNATGLAFAEKSPLMIISGGPETKYHVEKPLLHHCVKSFQTQYRVFVEVTESQCLISSPDSAQRDIDRVFENTIRSSRPGYIEVPRDMTNCEMELHDRVASSTEEAPDDPVEFEEAMQEIIGRLNASHQPVLFAGVEIRRFNLMGKVIALAEALNIPVVTSILGKASFPETHPNFIGNYFGKFGNPQVKEYVESSDCILCLGAILTEMETAGYTAKLPPEKLIQVTYRHTTVGERNYFDLDLHHIIDELLNRTKTTLKPNKFQIPFLPPDDMGSPSGIQHLTVAGIIEDLNKLMSDDYIVICDVGDCLYAGMSIKTNLFIAPGFYSSMGFGVPAAIGAQVAAPTKRPIVLVGDGGFQMTGLEISTAVKLGLNPIVIVFNNASYAMLKFIDQQRDYYDLPRWDYTAIAKAVGATGAKTSTRADFQRALKEAVKSDQLFLIDAVIPQDDISPTLKRLTDHFGKKMKAAVS